MLVLPPTSTGTSTISVSSFCFAIVNQTPTLGALAGILIGVSVVNGKVPVYPKFVRERSRFLLVALSEYRAIKVFKVPGSNILGVQFGCNAKNVSCIYIVISHCPAILEQKLAPKLSVLF
jgi:hypothetical protein